MYTRTDSNPGKNPARATYTARIEGLSGWLEKKARSAPAGWQLRDTEPELGLAQLAVSLHLSEFLNPCTFFSFIQDWNTQVSILQQTCTAAELFLLVTHFSMSWKSANIHIIIIISLALVISLALIRLLVIHFPGWVVLLYLMQRLINNFNHWSLLCFF